MSIWQGIGVVLIAWLAWDLTKGDTLLHRRIDCETEPGFYWPLIALWAVIAFSLIASPLMK